MGPCKRAAAAILHAATNSIKPIACQTETTYVAVSNHADRAREHVDGESREDRESRESSRKSPIDVVADVVEYPGNLCGTRLLVVPQARGCEQNVRVRTNINFWEVGKILDDVTSLVHCTPIRLSAWRTRTVCQVFLNLWWSI